MLLSEDQLRVLFQYWLKEYILPRSYQHLPLFDDLGNGQILVNRLKLVLKQPKLRHLQYGTKFRVSELYELAYDRIKHCGSVYIVGLNYKVTLYDLEALKKIYEREYP